MRLRLVAILSSSSAVMPAAPPVDFRTASSCAFTFSASAAWSMAYFIPAPTPARTVISPALALIKPITPMRAFSKPGTSAPVFWLNSFVAPAIFPIAAVDSSIVFTTIVTSVIERYSFESEKFQDAAFAVGEFVDAFSAKRAPAHYRSKNAVQRRHAFEQRIILIEYRARVWQGRETFTAPVEHQIGRGLAIPFCRQHRRL